LTTTVAPRSANVPAMAAPILVDEPVTRATRPSSGLGPVNDSTSTLSSRPFTSHLDGHQVEPGHSSARGPQSNVSLAWSSSGLVSARCARVGRVASLLHFLCEPSGHTSTVSRCATGSNPRNPQSQSCGPRGARTRSVWHDARSVAGKGRKVLGRSRWDCGLRRCEAHRWASGTRSCSASGSDVHSSGRSSTVGLAIGGNLDERAVFDRDAGAEKASNPGTRGKGSPPRIQLSGRITPRVRDGRAASGCSPRAFDTPCSGGTRRCAG
jgi:hypothetical protein